MGAAFRSSVAVGVSRQGRRHGRCFYEKFLFVDSVGGASVEPRAARCSIEMERRGGRRA